MQLSVVQSSVILLSPTNNGLLQQTPRSFIAVIVLNGFRVILKRSLLLHTAYASTIPKSPVISYWVRFVPTTNFRFSMNRYYTVDIQYLVR